jgi:lipid A 3-O-deacylase
MGLASRPTTAFLAALPFVALCAAPARAADAPATPTIGPFSFFDEIRGGVFSDVLDTSWESVSVEALSSQLPFYSGSNPFLAAFLKPRLDVGAMVSVEGHISYAYTGVNWHVPIYDRLFAEGEFGGALNDSVQGRPGWLGCPVTFRESGGLGLQITSNVDVVASIEHVSHANLCGRQNPGLTNFGLRLGYKF